MVPISRFAFRNRLSTPSEPARGTRRSSPTALALSRLFGNSLAVIGLEIDKQLVLAGRKRWNRKAVRTGTVTVVGEPGGRQGQTGQVIAVDGGWSVTEAES